VRVLYLLGGFPIPPLGGVELSIYEVAREIARQGAEVRVLSPSAAPRSTVVDRVEFRGLTAATVSTWIRIPSPSSYRVLRDDVAWSDVVHVWNPQELFNLVGIGLAARMKRPTVLSTPIVSDLGSHPRTGVRWAGRIDDAIVHRALRRAGLVHVQSPEAARAASRWSDRIRYIPGGVPESVLASPPTGEAFRAAHGLGSAHPVLLFLGRCHPLKGPDQLVRALPAVLGALPDAIAVIAGADFEGSLEALRHLSRELAVTDRVRVLGPVSDAERVGALDAADVVVVPSRADFVEGFSLVVSEAWARGRPVAAYPVGALRGRVRDGTTGCLARGREPSDLADAIVRAAALPPFERPADVIGWSEVAVRFRDIYAELVARSGSAVAPPPAIPSVGGVGGVG
jgi:glycosyltransferase involved in cell wall biosynthesis